jgi:hypothetical protein
MAEHKECKHYEDCSYRNDIGVCPNWCAQFKHKDDVRVVRCEKCRYYEKAEYDEGYKMVCRLLKRQTASDGFCYCGERKKDNV